MDIAFICIIACFLILFGLQFSHSARIDQYDWIIQLRRIGDPVISVPASWAGYSWPTMSHNSFLIFLPLFFAFATWVVKISFDVGCTSGLRMIDRGLGKGQAGPGAARGAGVSALRGGRSIPTHTETEKTREELLQRYREIESALKSTTRKRCTFLSVDVVGSTTMKTGEDETAIAATFQAYNEMLRKIFDDYGAWKQAWTPDGVMVCFLQTELAVNAARRILESLVAFNMNDNKLHTPFQVRCGMNEGEIPIFEDSKLEKVSDRTIDIAGHMQKFGTPGTLWASPAVYNALADKAGFVPTPHEVDGLKVFQWTPAAIPASSSAVASP